ncbi:molybdopterin-dependent oxidoreductase [Methanobrevibacter sp. OttesenSCG-928-I08]|nr:molybdopterin-dependent oxidoreductase [Methanobrevibacter sp. OttesenSCG-928-I08]
MLIKNNICPSCSVGCGINLITNEEKVVGTYPLKNHPINEGKNCFNGKNAYKSIYEKKFLNPLEPKGDNFTDLEWSSAIESILEIINSNNEIGIISSGKLTNEENKAIADFCENKNISNTGFYCENFPKIESVITNYDEIENASFLLVIGDILIENPLIGRRIIIAKDKGVEVYSTHCLKDSISSYNSDKYFDSIDDLSDEIKDKLDENSVILFNVLDSKEDFEKISEIAKDAKVLGVLPDSNSKGAMDYFPPLNTDEINDLIDSVKVLIIVGDDLDEISYDKLKNLDSLIYINSNLSKLSKISDYSLPIPSWGEKSGSFTNTLGKVQSFEKIIEPDENVFSVEEIFNKLLGK